MPDVKGATVEDIKTIRASSAEAPPLPAKLSKAAELSKIDSASPVIGNTSQRIMSDFLDIFGSIAEQGMRLARAGHTFDQKTVKTLTGAALATAKLSAEQRAAQAEGGSLSLHSDEDIVRLVLASVLALPHGRGITLLRDALMQIESSSSSSGSSSASKP